MPVALHLSDPDYGRQRAEESRALAMQIDDKAAKQTMLWIADDCDNLAARASAHLNDDRTSSFLGLS